MLKGADMTLAFEATKKQFIDDLDVKVEKGITEKASADFLKRLIENIETEEDLLALQSLATLYKKSGFVFTPVQEKLDNTIKYLSKNDEKSFDQGGIHHKLIVGDNYPALQNLLITHRGQIDVIYIDPPYGKDAMGEFANTNYNNAISRDNLLSMLYPRLQLARQLLAEDGVLFCSIDDKNQAYVKGLLDDVFGEENFAGIFPWRKRTVKSDVPFGISQDYEYILIYAKSDTFVASVDGKGRKYYETDDFPNRPWRYTALTKQTTAEERPNSYFTIVNPATGEEYPADPNRTWSVTKETIKEYIQDDRIIFPGDYDFLRISKPVFRYWKADDEAKDGEMFGRVTVSTNLPKEVGMTKEGTADIKSLFGNKIFLFPKPVALIKYLISISTFKRDNAVILDFFAGSGTTGQAVLELNKQDGGTRQFILCTNNEESDGFIADNVTTKRLKRVMTGECYDGTSDFKWLDNNEPYGDSLDVYDIERVSSFASAKPSAIDVIDEANYGKSFDNINDKIAWVCQNFHVTQKSIPPYGEVEFNA